MGPRSSAAEGAKETRAGPCLNADDCPDGRQTLRKYPTWAAKQCIQCILKQQACKPQYDNLPVCSHLVTEPSVDMHVIEMNRLGVSR